MSESIDSIPGERLIRPNYRTKPDSTLKTMPPGIAYIVVSEVAERFSFYGMTSILTVFMTTYLLNDQGLRDVMNNYQAAFWSHQFVSAVYCMSLLGAFLADGLLGKYKTMLYLSVVYCLGHFILAINNTRLGLAIGLCLVAMGAGAVKTCVSANVGDQFGEGNRRLLSRAFGWCYFGINVGAWTAVLICPILLESTRFGPHYAFGLPGVLMCVATLILWLGRKKLVHVPPAGHSLLREFRTPECKRALANLGFLYLFLIVWVALYYQSVGIEWSLQAKRLDLNFMGIKILPEQVQLADPVLIVILVPLFQYIIYPTIGRFFRVTALGKIGVGLVFMIGAYVIMWYLQTQIDVGAKPNVSGQLLAYVFVATSEVLVSVTGFEFSYTQAPNKLKSFVMALWLTAIALGNQFAAIINLLIATLDQYQISILKGANYYAFYVLLMFFVFIIFVGFTKRYRGQTFLQGSA